jgi:hypothetical protein
MVFETKEQIYRRKRHAVFRFRSLVTKAFFNSAWLSEIDEKIGEDAKRNIAIILNRRKKGVISVHDKSLLMKQPQYRTEEDFQRLQKLFNTFSAFQKYSPVNYAIKFLMKMILNKYYFQSLRRQLMGALRFQYIPKEKVIYQEGHPALSMAFLLTGKVLVSRQTFDKIKGEIVDAPINTLESGAILGALGLLKNQPRVATCTAERK